jgi:uncharacterized membrane protein YgdD (TMEM256/DUF423 family)
MNQRTTFLWGSAAGLLAVAIGAFGAHALKGILTANGRLETYELAVRYHFYHALALLLAGIIMKQYPSKLIQYASLFFLFGILIFCGSLYLLSFTGIGILGAITPLGGVCFILGWGLLFAGVYKK